MTILKYSINPNLIPFTSPLGQYVEVLGLIGNNLALVYDKAQLETHILPDNHGLTFKPGDKLFFNDDGTYNPDLKENKTNESSGVTSCNKQSPSRLTKDPHSRC